jgi:hypothetical protein
MHYTNDNQDRTLRKKNFLLTVYVLPIAVALLIFGITYYISEKNWFPNWDIYYSYFISAFVGFFLSGRNKAKWLAMPDKSYFHVQGISPTHKPNPNEPAQYEEEYFYAKKINKGTAISGLILIGLGIFIRLNVEKSLLVPLMTIGGGIFFFYSGFRGLQDKSPQLKLASEGLWTKKLGFVGWDDIAKTEVMDGTNGTAENIFLDIYLKGNGLRENKLPDERLDLTNIEDNQFVEMFIHELTNKRNALKS